MILAIVGSRGIKDLDRSLFETAYQKHIAARGIEVTGIVSGGAEGVDTFAKLFARRNNIPFTEFLALWDDLDAPGAVVKYNSRGRPYNARAGFDRNKKIVAAADVLLAIWDGESKGTGNSIWLAHGKGIPVYIEEVPW